MRALIRLSKRSAAALLAGVAMMMAAGCGTTSEVTSYTNPISGRRTDLMNSTLLESDNSREMLWLTAYRDFHNRFEAKTYLEVIYGANREVGLIDILPGRSLMLIVDGDELAYSGLGSLDRKEDGNALFESARYEVNPSDLSRIANAKKVTVQLRGRNGLVIRDFGPENFQAFQKFVNQADAAPL